jgi:WD repeat-containing protein 35
MCPDTTFAAYFTFIDVLLLYSLQTNVVFWDLVSLEAHTKSVSNLKFIAAGGDLCALVLCEKSRAVAPVAAVSKKDSKSKGKDRKGGDDDEDEPAASKAGASEKAPAASSDVYSIQLRNSIGAVVDTKILPFVPKYLSMSATHVIVANDRTVYAWQFQSQVARTGLATASVSAIGAGDAAEEGARDSPARAHQSKVRMFDIANTSFTTAQSPETFQIISETIADPVVSTTISDKFLVVGRKSGAITRFNLPHLTPENTYTVQDREPSRMMLNCSSSKLGLIDTNGLFSILDLEARVTEADADSKEGSRSILGPYFGKKLGVERKDVWDMRWSEDDPDMVVIMEKTKMVVFNGETAEEPVVSSAYLCRFKDLEVRVVAMDSLVMHPDKISRDCVIDFETRTLREVRDVITTEGLQGGYVYAEKHSHPRLWKLLATAAVEDLELVIAEKAFVRCGDYYGIQLVKQLQAMTDKMKARAEACVYLNKIDEAETIYREIDRKDLAIQLRKRLGDYSRVVQLLQTGGGNDALVREAWDKIGEHYADRLKWKKAAQYFVLSRNFEQLAECYYRLENFAELSKMKLDLPDDHPLLITLAKRFETVGLHEEAVECYLRSTRPPKEAVDCCVLLNKWDMALELAERYDYPQVEGLLIKYAMNLLSNDRKLEAVELFRVANKPTETAILIGDIAETVATRNVNPALAKKLHVLAALEIERHRKRTMDLATQAATTNGGDLAQATQATMDTLMVGHLITLQLSCFCELTMFCCSPASDDCPGRQPGRPRHPRWNTGGDPGHAERRHPGRREHEEDVQGLRQRLARRRGVPLLHALPQAVLRRYVLGCPPARHTYSLTCDDVRFECFPHVHMKLRGFPSSFVMSASPVPHPHILFAQGTWTRR